MRGLYLLFLGPVAALTAMGSTAFAALFTTMCRHTSIHSEPYLQTGSGLTNDTQALATTELFFSALPLGLLPIRTWPLLALDVHTFTVVPIVHPSNTITTITSACLHHLF